MVSALSETLPWFDWSKKGMTQLRSPSSRRRFTPAWSCTYPSRIGRRRPLFPRPFRTVAQPAPGLLVALSGILASRRREQRKNGEKTSRNGRDMAYQKECGPPFYNCGVRTRVTQSHSITQKALISPTLPWSLASAHTTESWRHCQANQICQGQQRSSGAPSYPALVLFFAMPLSRFMPHSSLGPFRSCDPRHATRSSFLPNSATTAQTG